MSIFKNIYYMFYNNNEKKVTIFRLHVFVALQFQLV